MGIAPYKYLQSIHLCNCRASIVFPLDKHSSPAAISRHLSVLKETDLVYDTREGKFIYYTLNTSVLEETILWLAVLKGE